MKKIFFSLLVLFILPAVSVFAQEEAESTSETIFVIHSFEFIVHGMTRPFALINKAELRVGEEITGHSNLERFVRDKRQLLMNERVLESVRVEYTVGHVREDGKYPVDLIFHIKDTWNIIAIPRPQYSSNSGLDITIKARDYNFLGTMSPLRFDIGYQRDLDGRDFYTLMLDSDIPFRLFDLNWCLNFDHDYTYRPDMSQPHYYRNVTGLSVEIPFYFTTPTIGFDVHFIVNEENSDIDKPLYGDFQDGLYISTRPFISWKIPTGLNIDSYGELTYTPRISATFNHQVSSWTLQDHRKGPFAAFSHSLGFGRINWLENFQQGFSVNASNSFSYDFNSRDNIDPLTTSISFTGIGHFVFTDFLGFSTRLMYRHWFNSYNDKAGDVLRGVLDRDIQADFMISLNLDLPVRVLRIRPSEWFNNSKLRVFNFDLHMSPVIDMAIYQYSEAQNSFGKENFLISGGLETIIFPDFFRSLYLRISVGWDFSDISTKTPMEIFIGTELHF